MKESYKLKLNSNVQNARAGDDDSNKNGDI